MKAERDVPSERGRGDNYQRKGHYSRIWCGQEDRPSVNSSDGALTARRVTLANL